MPASISQTRIYLPPGLSACYRDPLAMRSFAVPPPVNSIGVALLALLLLGGCVGQRFYRPESIVHREGYDLAFVELDDQGELWSNKQVLAADKLIRDASAADGLVLNVFIHGWQHNASEGDSNIAGFESMLAQIAEFESLRQEGPPRRVVGVFVGWRGKTARLRLLAPFTFYGRFGAARRVASTATTEMIFRLLLAGRVNPRSTTVVVGHSFGGLILESALSQAIIGGLGAALQKDAQEVEFPADLVLLINPASQSIEAKQLVDIFERHHLKFYREGEEGETYEVPLVVSMTSTADLATRVLFPLGMRLKAVGNTFRPYGSESCARGRQSNYFRRTAGHQRSLHSHLVDAVALAADRVSDDAALVRAFRGSLTHTYDPATRLQTWSAEGERLRYAIRQNPRSWNDTPYWIMEVPPAILPDHSRIFGRETIEFAGALIAMSGALEGGDHRSRLVRDDRIGPVLLAAREDGSIALLDRSQQIFEIDPSTSELRLVGCMPEELTAVEEVIGVAGARGSPWVAGTIRGYGKKADEHRVGVTRLGADERGVEAKAGVEGKARALPDGIEAAAAAFDLDRSRMFLARAALPEIDVIDLAQRKGLDPIPLVDLGTSGPMQILAYDSKRDRLFASDGRSTVITVDLTVQPPRIETVATDLELPTALAFDQERARLYVATESDGAIWRLDCEESCGPPRRLAASDQIDHPRTLAVDAEGMVWVGDLETGTIGQVSPEGELLKVIKRLPES